MFPAEFKSIYAPSVRSQGAPKIDSRRWILLALGVEKLIGQVVQSGVAAG
jgi:hypothetical protein